MRAIHSVLLLPALLYHSVTLCTVDLRYDIACCELGFALSRSCFHLDDVADFSSIFNLWKMGIFYDQFTVQQVKIYCIMI